VIPLLLRAFGRDFLRTLVTAALTLEPASGSPRDTLRLNGLKGQLDLEWRARPVHPWDRDLSGDRQAARFCDQTIADTERVIHRLFRDLPDVDTITLRVVEPGDSGGLLLAGTVFRHDVAGARVTASPRMRLWMWGVNCSVIGDRLEPLNGRTPNPLTVGE
jgi:hypothetical protein